MVKVDLIQPRHNYAPAVSESALWHVYMPTSLLTAAARLIAAGVDVELHDENIKPMQLSSSYVGINLLGAPYIPEVIKLQKEIDERVQEKAIYLLGGQVVSSSPNGLSQKQFKRLFGDSAYNGNDDKTLASVLGIEAGMLSPPEITSLIPAYEKIPDEMMKMYLSKEFGLYVSQGCMFHCDFCGANRTILDTTGKPIIQAEEVYRNPKIIKDDLEYLVKKAKSFGIKELNIYMSNLDTFQKPHKLHEFAYAVKDVKQSNPGFEIRLRGLSTPALYVNARDKHAKYIENLVEAGFHTAGFGVDGMTPQVWKGVHKEINDEKRCLEAIQSARRDFGIIPEILMVFGHVGVDTEKTLKLACEFTQAMVDTYEAVPRPHVAKNFIPGNKGWIYPGNVKAIELLLKNPESFQGLDFTSLASPLTHPDGRLRELTNHYYKEICNIEGNTTQWVMPITPDLTPKQIEEVKKSNKWKYDR